MKKRPCRIISNLTWSFSVHRLKKVGISYLFSVSLMFNPLKGACFAFGETENL